MKEEVRFIVAFSVLFKVSVLLPYLMASLPVWTWVFMIPVAGWMFMWAVNEIVN